MKIAVVMDELHAIHVVVMVMQTPLHAGAQNLAGKCLYHSCLDTFINIRRIGFNCAVVFSITPHNKWGGRSAVMLVNGGSSSRNHGHDPRL
jgi:hypothetical protein